MADRSPDEKRLLTAVLVLFASILGGSVYAAVLLFGENQLHTLILSAVIMIAATVGCIRGVITSNEPMNYVLWWLMFIFVLVSFA